MFAVIAGLAIHDGRRNQGAESGMAGFETKGDSKLVVHPNTVSARERARRRTAIRGLRFAVAQIVTSETFSHCHIRHTMPRWATWPYTMGQVAQMEIGSVPRPGIDTTKTDLDRFRQYLQRGAPGPHAYVTLLGLKTFDYPDLVRAVTKGLPYRTFERFRRNTSLSFERIADLIDIPRRTMTRRKREGRFLPDESDRLLRASRLLGKTLELFEGDMDAAAEWLTTAQPGLGGSVPLDIARSELGVREVERLVSRLEHGVFS